MGRRIGIAGIVVLLLVQWARAELREFRLPDGRSIRAEIVSFSAGKVALKLENGRIKKVPPKIFVEEDQRFIKEWAMLDAFRNPAFFKISSQKNLVEKWKEELESNVSYGSGNVEKENIGEMKFEKFAYKLTLENRNAIPVENIEVEYCIFCKEKGKGHWRKNAAWFKKAKKGSVTIEKLPAKKKKTVETDPVVVGRQEITGDIYNGRTGGGFEKIGAEVEGIWVRVTVTTPDGQKAVRELFSPDTLEGKYAWPTK